MFKLGIKTVIKGFLFGLGVCLSVGLFVTAHAYLNNYALSDDLAARFSPLNDAKANDEATEDKQPTTIVKAFVAAQTPVPKDFTVTIVNTAEELQDAVSAANNAGGKAAIYLQDGVYKISETIRISASNIMFLSVSNNPYQVTIKGAGMKRTNRVQNIFEVRANGFVLDGIRLAEAPNHLIQIAGENNASGAIVRNCILQDSFEQLLKVSYDQASRPANISYDGIVEHCIFQYTQGRAPYYYTGGIDALGAKNWRVEHNIFKDIASPGKRIAQHAVHFWVNASNNIVRNNIFIDNDRSIGFGMKQKKRETESLDYVSKGGEISGNVIYHSDNGDPFADTGIILEASAETIIKDNYIFMQHNYPRAIEYRFKETQNAIIENNHTNKAIRSRDGGHAVLKNNNQNLDSLVFLTELEQKMRAKNILNLEQPINSEISND